MSHRRPRTLLLALAAVGGLGLGTLSALGPAQAAPLSAPIISPSHVAPSGSVEISGECLPGDPVTIRLGDTSGGSVETHQAVTTADPTGTFRWTYTTSRQWRSGTSLAVTYFCLPTASTDDLRSALSYLGITTPDPWVRIDAPRQIAVGDAAPIRVRHNHLGGSAVVRIGSTTLDARSNLAGTAIYDLPTTLTPGTHTVTATFQGVRPDDPAATATHTLVVVPVPAADDPPTVASVTPGPITPGTNAVISGTCPAGSTSVSARLTDNAGSSPVTINGVTTPVPTAHGPGIFSWSQPITPSWPSGSQIAVSVSCTAIFSTTQASPPRYVYLDHTNDWMFIEGPATVRHGTSATLKVRHSWSVTAVSAAIGSNELTTAPTHLPGDPTFTIPADLAVGSYSVTVTSVLGAPVTRTHHFSITPRTAVRPPSVQRASTLVMRTAKKRVRKNAKVSVTLTVRAAGTGSRAGRVVIYDGKKVIKRVTLPGTGKARVTIRLKRVGRHTLRASYAGNATTKASSSRRVAVRVRR